MATRGGKYRKSKYHGCGTCKSHKRGWSRRFKAKEAAIRSEKID